MPPGILAIIAFFWENKVMVVAPGWVALALIGYTQVFQIAGLSEDTKDIKRASIETRLDRNYTLLCMHPGDQDILNRIRDLQSDYEKVTGGIYYPLDCNLLLDSVG